jgi:hypothetical protein
MIHENTAQGLWGEARSGWCRNPVLKVLSILSTRQVRFLSMRGQACVFYCTAELGRDSDVILFPEPEDLERLRLKECRTPGLLIEIGNR